MITVSTESGPLGTISLDDGELKASSSGLQDIADETVQRTGSAAIAYQVLANTSNGYVHYTDDGDFTRKYLGLDTGQSHIEGYYNNASNRPVSAVEKCLSCGCGLPHEDHGDHRNITVEDVEAAGQAANLAPGAAASNVANGYRTMTELAGKKWSVSFSTSQLADLIKVGAEGYIHGYICVRPPCGDKGGRVSHPVHGIGLITERDQRGEVHARFSDGTTGTLGDPEAKPRFIASSDDLPQDTSPDVETIVSHNQDVLSALNAGQEYTDAQLNGVRVEMSNLEQNLKQLHAERMRGFKDQLDEETYEEIKKKVSWHIGFIITGGVVAALVSVFTLGIPVAAAGITAVMASIPVIGQELNDLKNRWG